MNEKQQVTDTAELKTTSALASYATEVNKYMDLLARSYPELVSIEEIGRTHENRTLRVLRISTARHGRRHRKAILIDGGIHAREWVAPAMVLYVVNQIVEHRSSNGEMLEGVDWFALPVVNPDGYEFTHSYVGVSNGFMWKNGKSGPDMDQFWPDMIFPYEEDEVLNELSMKPSEINIRLNPEPCSNLYAGTEPFSEPESRALSSFMLDNMPFIKMYLTFHSFGQDELARKAAEAIVKTGGPRFEVGSSSNVLSFGAGGADDFAKGRANVKYAYTVEMPGGGPNGFDLPATSLCLHLHSLYQGLRVMVKALREE
uniref:Peptidase M14 domain-containing protein n=1 Tax=Timema shepardi TaxID=629360 RepID=A0A7R9ARE6_TIMSH|nr:unnamed protein product [Timema shepardi]